MKFTLEKINDILKLNLEERDINNIYTIGKKAENKPIIIEFVTYITKQNLYRNCKFLKGTNVRISEVLTKEEREEQKLLIPYFKKAKENKQKAHIKRNILYINSKAFSSVDLQKSSYSKSQTTPADSQTYQTKNLNENNVQPLNVKSSEDDSDQLESEVFEDSDAVTHKVDSQDDKNKLKKDTKSQRRLGGDKQIKKVKYQTKSLLLDRILFNFKF